MSGTNDCPISSKGDHQIAIGNFSRPYCMESKPSGGTIFGHDFTPSVQKPTSRPLGGFGGIFTMQIEDDGGSQLTRCFHSLKILRDIRIIRINLRCFFEQSNCLRSLVHLLKNDC